MRLLFLLLFLCAVAPAQPRLFSFEPSHTAFSTSLNRLVITEYNLKRLHLYGLATGDDTVLPLPAFPTALSVSPDGLSAAVGHENQVTYFQLSSASLLRTLRVPGTVRQLLLAPPSAIVDLGNDNVRSLAVASGALSGPIIGIKQLNSPQLSPDGRTLYSTGGNQLDRVDLLSGTVSSSPLQHCGRILLSPDTSRLYTGCGTVLQNTSDLPYVRTLQSDYRSVLVATSSEFVAIAAEQTIKIYKHSDLEAIGQISLPLLPPERDLSAFPFAVFFDATGSRLHVVSYGNAIGRAWSGNQAGVQTFDLTNGAGNCVSSVRDNETNRTGQLRTLEAGGGLLSLSFRASDFCGYLPTTDDPWITLVNPRFAFGSDVITVHVAPNPSSQDRSGRIGVGSFSAVITQ